MNSDWKKLRRFAVQLFPAGYAGRWRGRFAPRHRRCEFPSAFCPGASRLAIKRLQRTVGSASKLANPPAADPQRRSAAQKKGLA
jgi:hypothetical protein